MLRIKIYIGLILFLLVSTALSGRGNDRQEVKDFLQKGNDALLITPQQSVYLANKALKNLPTEGKDEAKTEVLLTMGLAQKLLGDFDSSIKTLYQAIDCCPANETNLLGQIYTTMAGVYSSMDDHTRAFDLIEKATSAFKSTGDSIGLASSYNTRGIIHCNINEYKEAEKYLHMALQINRRLKNLKAAASNLNNLCLFQGNTNEKLALIDEAIAINKNLNSYWSLGENYNNKGKQFFFGRRYPEALKALAEAKKIATRMGAKGLICDNYEYCAWVYSAMGDYKNAYSSQLKLHELSKELQSNNKLRNVELEISQKRYLNQEREAQLKEHVYEIELLKRNMFLLCVVLVLFIVLTVSGTQWYKHRKNRQLIEARRSLEQSEYQIAELKMQQQELELKNVNEKLGTSRQEITTFAVFLESRNELLDKIRDMVKEGYKMDSNALVAHLKKINSFISRCQDGDKNNSALLVNIEQKSSDFMKRLLQLHPDLTPGERYLATLLRVNLSTKDISLLTGTLPKSINMNRYRLRKALNLQADEDLTDYLQSI